VAFDLSGLSTPARMGFAQALLRFLFALVEEEEKVPFVFFEEAHLYVTPQGNRCPGDEGRGTPGSRVSSSRIHPQRFRKGF
jgi:hypothetical protein